MGDVSAAAWMAHAVREADVHAIASTKMGKGTPTSPRKNSCI